MSARARSFGAAAAMLALGGCGDVWLGGSEDPPLPGERVPVMLLDAELSADESAGGRAFFPPPPRAGDDWPQAGGGAAHAPIRLVFDAPPERTWRRSVGEESAAAGGLPSPVVGQETIYVMDGDGEVAAYGLSDGSERWRSDADGFDPSDRLKTGGLAWAQGWLYVVTSSGAVFGRNAETGEAVWRADLQAPIRSAPTVEGEILLVLTADNRLYALDRQSGELLWRHAGVLEQAAMLGGSAPAIGDGVALAPYSSGEVFALELDTGRELWADAVLRPRRTLAIGAINDIDALPAIADGVAYVAGQGGETAAIDLRFGSRLWEVDIASTQTPWVAGDVVYVVSDRADVAAIDRADGLIRWVAALPRTVDPTNPDAARIHWAGPVFAGDALWLAGSNGRLIGLDPINGEEIAVHEIDDGIWTAPIVAQGAMVLYSAEAELSVYR